MIRDYIKQASQHGLTRQENPPAPAAGRREQPLPASAGGSQPSPAAGEGDNISGQRREYGRVMSAPAKAADPGYQSAGPIAAPRGGAYDPDVAPRIRTVKMRGLQPRVSQEGLLHR